MFSPLLGLVQFTPLAGPLLWLFGRVSIGVGLLVLGGAIAFQWVSMFAITVFEDVCFSKDLEDLIENEEA